MFAFVYTLLLKLKSSINRPRRAPKFNKLYFAMYIFSDIFYYTMMTTHVTEQQFAMVYYS